MAATKLLRLRACGSRGVSRAPSPRRALLLLFSLALFASFRYETFHASNLMNIMRQNSMLAIVTLGMTVVILKLISPWAPSLLWAASSQQCSPDRGPRGNRRRHCKRHLARCGKRSSRVPRGLQPFVVTLFTERCAGWR